jgi:DNA repair exonuclease SbcCD nuclease subunit
LIIPYFSDSQIRFNSSENRLGNYWEDIITKFKEILSIAKKNKSPFILCGGDFFDLSNISLNLCDDLGELVNKNKIPIYSIWGNHSEEGHSKENSKATVLAHLFRTSNWMKYLDLLELDDCIIKGFDYYHDCEQNIKDNGLILDKETKKWKIAIVHAFITEKKFLDKVLHIPYTKIKTNFDLVLSGHLHHPFNKTIDDTIFLNTGCVGRLKTSEVDIEPSIALLDTETRSFKIIKLKSAKPKEEIFDLTKIQEIKAFESDIEKFIASLKSTKFNKLDLLGMIKEIGKQRNIEKDVIQEVENRILNYKE